MVASRELGSRQARDDDFGGGSALHRSAATPGSLPRGHEGACKSRCTRPTRLVWRVTAYRFSDLTVVSLCDTGRDGNMKPRRSRRETVGGSHTVAIGARRSALGRMRWEQRTLHPGICGARGGRVTPEADKPGVGDWRTAGWRLGECAGDSARYTQTFVAPTARRAGGSHTAPDMGAQKKLFWKTNPSLCKPAWKSYRNKAKNKPIFRGGRLAR
jgi:hypothetical protein